MAIKTPAFKTLEKITK